MDLRDAIRTIIREVAEPELRRIVREVLLEELVAENPRTTAAKKAAVTRAENKKAGSVVGRVPKPSTAKVPERARKFGVFRGQQYKGKPHAKKVRDRTIEVVRLDDRYVYPRILGSANKNAKAKRISYETLQKSYDRVV